MGLFAGMDHSASGFSYRRRDFCLGVPGRPMRWNQIQVRSRGAIGMVKGWMGHMATLVFVARTVVTVSLRGGASDVAESSIIESD